MKKILGLMILGILASASSFASSTVCYKMAKGFIQEVKDINYFNYVCIETDDNCIIDVKVYEGHKAHGKEITMAEYPGCVEVNNLPSFNYQPKNQNNFDDRATTIFNPKAILCKTGTVIAYEEPSDEKPVTRFIMDGERYSITTTNFILPLMHPMTH